MSCHCLSIRSIGDCGRLLIQPRYRHFRSVESDFSHVPLRNIRRRSSSTSCGNTVWTCVSASSSSSKKVSGRGIAETRVVSEPQKLLRSWARSPSSSWHTITTAWQLIQSAGSTSRNVLDRLTMLLAEEGWRCRMSIVAPSWWFSSCFKCDNNDTTIVTVTGPDHSQRHTRPELEIDVFMVQATPLGRRDDAPSEDPMTVLSLALPSSPIRSMTGVLFTEIVR